MIPQDEYYKNIPKKRMGAGVLIADGNDRFLFVKLAYKNNWSIPGGVIETNESPRTAAIRETKEEVHIDLQECIFLCLDYKSGTSENGESLQFIFSGGILNDKTKADIKVDGEEIVECKFMKLEKALPLLSEGLRKRLPKCFESLKSHKVIYLEDGEAVQ